MLNVVLNLILMWPLRQGGIALATVLSSSFNNLSLIWILRRQGYAFKAKPVISTAVKVLLAAVPAAAAARFLYAGALSFDLILWKKELVPLLVMSAIFVFLFTLFAGLLHCPELRENYNLFRRKI